MADTFNFKNLLEDATGKDFNSITDVDVADWAGAQGWRQKDIKRVVRGFNKFSRRENNELTLAGPGEFTAPGTTGSGRRTGNRAGFDIGDVVGLGRDVSTLAGALETTKKNTTGTPVDFTAPLKGVDTQLNPVNIKQPQFVNVKGASGQAGEQVVSQEINEVQKARTSKSVATPEGVGEIAISPDESLPPFQSSDLSPTSPINAAQPPQPPLVGPQDLQPNTALDRGLRRLKESRFGKGVGRFFDRLDETANSLNLEGEQAVGSFEDVPSGVDAITQYLGGEGNFEGSPAGQFVASLNPSALLIGQNVPRVDPTSKLKTAIESERLGRFKSKFARTKSLEKAKQQKDVIDRAASIKKAGQEKTAIDAAKALEQRRAEALNVARGRQFSDILKPSIEAGATPTANVNLTRNLKVLPERPSSLQLSGFEASQSVARRIGGNAKLNRQFSALKLSKRKIGELIDDNGAIIRVRKKGSNWETYRFGGKMKTKFSR